MFTEFYYRLRERGIKVSTTEWLALMEGLEKGLHESTMSGFYNLCRAVLLKTESDFDKFDQVFLEYFEDVSFSEELPKIPDKMMEWLNSPSVQLQQPEHSFENLQQETTEELIERFEERLEEQDSEHNGGPKWIATQGRSAFGNNGWHPDGIRVGGSSKFSTGRMVYGERKFRDFRKDNTLSTRQYQMAFRTLRRLALEHETSEKEFDLEGTIQATCNKGGMLQIREKPPRKNSIRLILLLDSGGSMEPHARRCSQLLQAAVQANFFKELHIYYFHNCVYESVFKEPTLSADSEVSTEWLLRRYSKEYRVILVGDAMMSEEELLGKRFDWVTRAEKKTGYEWLSMLVRQYPRLIWLNPHARSGVEDNWWGKTYLAIHDLLPMYTLSVEGLEKGMIHLLKKQ